MTTTLRPTVLVIRREALHANVRRIQSLVKGRPVMAVVKANAYGHGLIPTAQAFVEAGVSSLGVAFLEEGVALRRAGIRVPILVMGGIIGNQIHHFLEHDLAMTASSVHKLQQIDAVAEQRKATARVHLKIDTGMGRIGMQWDTAAALLEASLSTRRVTVDGVFSHLADADDPDSPFTGLQLERFLEATDFYDRRSVPAPTRHLANSAGVLQHPSTHLDLVRPGIALYGATPDRAVPDPVGLEPALALFTRVVYFKVGRAGRPVSYDRTWVPSRDTRIVTLPVGYGDGYARSLSNRGQVVLRGERYPVVGRVTMDAVMVDIGPDGTGYNGDLVLLLGSFQGRSVGVHEMAGWMGTIPYEVLTGLNTRIPRVYLDPGQVLDEQTVHRASVDGGEG